MFSVGVYLCWIILISMLTVITLFMIFAIQMALAFISFLCKLLVSLSLTSQFINKMVIESIAG